MIRKLLQWIVAEKNDSTLRERVIHSGIWATLLNVSDQVLRLLMTLILANLLSPSAFGVVAMAMIAIAVLTTFTTIGFNEALIQHEEDNVDSYLNTAWVAKSIRGAVLMVLMFTLAPFAAEFFDEPLVTPTLRALSIIPLLNGVVNPAVVYFKKDLRFRKQFVYQISGTAANFVVALTGAYILGNLWAIVLGALAGELFQVLASYAIDDFRPRVEFNSTMARELFSFGKWIQGSTIVVFIATRGDDLFVGWLLASGALGLYQIAFRYANAPTRELTHVITRVAFPTYSKLKADKQTLKRAFTLTIEATLLVSIPVAVGIILIAPEFVHVFLGKEWMEMIPALQVLAVSGVIRTLAATGGSLFKGFGVPRWDFWMNVPRTLTIVATIWPLTERFGITGTAISITLGLAMTLPIWFYKTRDITEIPVSGYLRSILTPILAVLIMTPPVLYVKKPTLSGVGIAILVGVVSYTVSGYFLLRLQGRDFIEQTLRFAREA
ncbi:lipopolysaccharide biosynthesis protein [Halosimplex aquaticum]|uniref:Lipopolysaccharide biosynthesis protein n=1 Tax=Halosimplex aquaticum TaxID=3026162 RepID=A0ABD5Y083_9EURY|nr:lipopolysaccharide biosynthesis protein [Halosimplex aquaticum]